LASFQNILSRVIFTAKQKIIIAEIAQNCQKKIRRMFKKVCTFSPLRHHNKGLTATSVEKASKYEGQICTGAITGATRMEIN
jgi:predicted nucleotidyltransferase